MNHAYVLTLSCPDRRGIVHAVSGFLFEHGGNIEEAAQYNDQGTGLFFMRVQFACDQLTHADLSSRLATFAEPFQMTWKLHDSAQPMRTVILVSKEGHCLNDLLFRWKSGLLPVDVRAIISNHREFYQLAASYNIPFHHLPVTAATKVQVEAKQLEIIRSEGAELVILARYMQEDQSIEEIVAAGFAAADVERVTRLIKINEYKRRQSPVGIRITHRAFGRDWRYPITSKFRA